MRTWNFKKWAQWISVCSVHSVQATSCSEFSQAGPKVSVRILSKLGHQILQFVLTFWRPCAQPASWFAGNCVASRWPPVHWGSESLIQSNICNMRSNIEETMNPRIRHEGYCRFSNGSLRACKELRERWSQTLDFWYSKCCGGRSGGRLCHARSLFMRKTLKMITVITVAPKLSQKAPLKHIVLKNCICSLLICPTKNNHWILNSPSAW